jgi:hypothetical protein
LRGNDLGYGGGRHGSMRGESLRASEGWCCRPATSHVPKRRRRAGSRSLPLREPATLRRRHLLVYMGAI